MILYKSNSVTLDWWSFGVLIYEMIFGQSPFMGKSNLQIVQNIIEKNVDLGNCEISPELKDLLTLLLDKK